MLLLLLPRLMVMLLMLRLVLQLMLQRRMVLPLLVWCCRLGGLSGC